MSERNGGIIRKSLDIVGSLPPAFVMLVVLNVAFLGMVMWFLNSQITARIALVDKVVVRCLDLVAHKPIDSELK